MKEFKKWLERGESGEGTGRYPRFGTIDEDAAAGKGWRAASKWIDDMLWLASGQVVNEVKERIKEELKS